MADIDYDDYGVAPRISGGQAQRLIHIAGAACSLALIAGVALWGYRLAVRDVTGVPVIRAVEGPMRVAPSNPGGDVADHQGMAVNVIAAVGGAAGLPDEIVLAPAPVELTAEDVPGLTALDPVAEAPEVAAPGPLGLVAPPVALAPPVAPVAEAVAPITAPDPVVAPADTAAAEPPVSTEDAVAMALAEALGDSVPLTPLAELDAPESAPLAEPDAQVSRTIRPRARPEAISAAAVPVESAPALASVGAEIDPTTLAAGTRLVQLGAFDSPEIARSEWLKLRERFGDLMTGKSLVVQSAQSGGRMFFRLRAHGFDGEDDARRFCAALLAENAACIPVAHR